MCAELCWPPALCWVHSSMSFLSTPANLCSTLSAAAFAASGILRSVVSRTCIIAALLAAVSCCLRISSVTLRMVYSSVVRMENTRSSTYRFLHASDRVSSHGRSMTTDAFGGLVVSAVSQLLSRLKSRFVAGTEISSRGGDLTETWWSLFAGDLSVMSILGPLE
jgi:hypothetical protein